MPRQEGEAAEAEAVPEHDHDPVKDAKDAEGRRAFQIMLGLVQGRTKTKTDATPGPQRASEPEPAVDVNDEDSDDSEQASARRWPSAAPPCLKLCCHESVSRPPCPCVVCGHLFGTWRAALRHHCPGAIEDEDPSPWFVHQCRLCGRGFPTELSVSLHVMCQRVQRRCLHCRETIEDEAERQRHVCPLQEDEAATGAESSRYRCPLGCAVSLPEESGMRQHLRALHGCDDHQILINVSTNELEVDLEHFSAKCRICGVKINTLNIPIEDHTIYHCPKRGALLKETIKGLQDLSEVSGVDVDRLVRLELESQLQEWLTHDRVRRGKESQDQRQDGTSIDDPQLKEDLAYLERCLQADRKYEGLPDQFYLEHLSKLPPDLASLDEENKEDLCFLVSMWNGAEERLFSVERGKIAPPAKETVVEFDRQVRLDLKESEEWLEQGEEADDWNLPGDPVATRTERQPPTHVLRRLEEELGFKIIDDVVDEFPPGDLGRLVVQLADEAIGSKMAKVVGSDSITDIDWCTDRSQSSASLDKTDSDDDDDDGSDDEGDGSGDDGGSDDDDDLGEKRPSRNCSDIEVTAVYDNNDRPLNAEGKRMSPFEGTATLEGKDADADADKNKEENSSGVGPDREAIDTDAADDDDNNSSDDVVTNDAQRNGGISAKESDDSHLRQNPPRRTRVTDFNKLEGRSA